MRHVVMFSGGVGSWAAAKRVAERHGTADLTLLFADTKQEDEDTYRFVQEAAQNVGAPLVTVADGRTPWEVFRDKRWLGNARLAQCSHLLKQEPCRRWMQEHAGPDATVYIGIDWTELHRLPGAEKGWQPWRVEAPMVEKPLLTKPMMLDWLRREGLRVPRLYEWGFSHNNCISCVRGGQAYFKRLLTYLPDEYRYHEQQEQALREYLDKDVSILREQVQGEKRPLTLAELRERIEADQQIDMFDIGGCGCFLDDGEAA